MVDARREITALHEAGHAVAGTVVGWSVRYATLRPHGGNAGATVWARSGRCHPLDAGAVCLAGMAAEATWHDSRRYMVEAARVDLRWARDTARHIVYVRERDGGWPGVDASWSEWDIGARMWHRARDLVAEYREAIDWTAAELCATSRAVPGSWVRDAVANSPRNEGPAEADDWWAPRYSRLAWRKGAAA